MWTGWDILTTRDLLGFWLRLCGLFWFALIWFGLGWLGSILYGHILLGSQDWSGMAEIHVAVSISWMGHTNAHTKKNKKKHDDMLSCCATKNYMNLSEHDVTIRFTLSTFQE